MDFIIKRLNNRLDLCEPGEYDYILYLRERIEYSLYLCLGYLWKNIDIIPIKKRTEIISNLSNMSIGQMVSAIRELDINAELLVSQSSKDILNNYPSIRNSKIGHSYSMSNDIASSLSPFYDELYNKIPFLKENIDLIIVNKFEDNIYKGIRLSYDKNGEGERWSCPLDTFGVPEDNFPRTYILKNGRYYKISPFVHLEEQGLKNYVFISLSDKLRGKTKLCQLFENISAIESQSIRTDNYQIRVFPELICISESKENFSISCSNGTVMNNFTKNYFHYIDVGISKFVFDFLKHNRASVSATIWGHGGVGKTACIQSVCHDLFNDTKKSFSHIVFVTAKDREYVTTTGEIVLSKGNVRKYYEVIDTIANILFGTSLSNEEDSERLQDNEGMIRSFDERALIVIDDYETFDDIEKEKISSFIRSLDISHHKVVITTRNKRFVIGEEISSNELDIPNTKVFLESIIEKKYPSHYNKIKELLADQNTLDKIHAGTSGRPIFIYQFAHIYVQRGYNDEFLEGLKSSKNAKEFLYGRIYDYLSENAKMIFATLSVLLDDDLRFRSDILEFILSKSISDKEKFYTGFEELQDLRIIEGYSEVSWRVYSSELKEIMDIHYKEYSQAFRVTIKNLLESLGGKSISGSVMEALLNEAHNSRPLGNEKETVEKYRRVLNTKECPYDIRKSALKSLAEYLSVNRLNTTSAVTVIEEYLSRFEDDAEIYRSYIYYLWATKYDEQKDFTDKTKAYDTILKFFNNPKHMKTVPENLAFFALGVGYCIDYDINLREYNENQALKLKQLNLAFKYFSKPLFEYVKKNSLYDESPSVRHNIRVALLQTLNLCSELGKTDVTSDKIEYGLDICSYMNQTELPDAFNGKVINSYKNLNYLIERRFPNKMHTPILTTNYSSIIDSWEEEVVSYSVEDIVNVNIIGIRPFGAIAHFGKNLTGLIHISEIDYRYIYDIEDEFEIGESCRAMIMNIDRKEKKIGLSTKGLGKFSLLGN